MQIRRSRQRDAILSYLKTRKDHPTAEQIYQDVRADMPNISLGTVYRNLSLLAELGEVRVLHQEGAEHFDAEMSPHDHFVCSRCGRIMDFQSSVHQAVEKDVALNLKGRLETLDLYCYGTCPDCL